MGAISDTAASITLIKKEIIDAFDLDHIDVQSIQTASGIFDVPIYELDIEILNKTLTTRVISSPISETLPFQGLIGRNILDYFDIYLLGIRQIFCIK